MNNLRIILGLMVLFIVFGFFAIFDPLRKGELDSERRERESRVIWLKDKTVDSFWIKGKSEDVKLDCQKKEKGCTWDGSGDWMISEPLKEKADPVAVGVLASSIYNLVHAEKISMEKAPDLKEFGLDEPTLELEMKIHGEADPVVLKFGKASAVGPTVYLSASHDSKHLFLVANNVSGIIDQGVFHWRNKRLFPGVDVSTVKSIQWWSDKGEFAADVRALRLTKPRAAVASAAMLNGLVSTAAYAEAKSVYYSPDLVDEESDEAEKAEMAKRKDLPKAFLEVSFVVDGGGQHKLTIYPYPPGKAAKELLARADSSPVVYIMEGSTFDRFQRGILEYRQSSVLSGMMRSQIEEVSLSFPRDKKQVTLKMVGPKWAAVAGDIPEGDISQLRVSNFLDSLRDRSFEGIVPLNGGSKEAKAFQSTPDVVVTGKLSGKALFEAKFVVFERKKALTEGEGEVKILGEEFLKLLPVRISDVVDVSNKKVTTLTVKSEKTGDSGKAEKAGGVEKTEAEKVEKTEKAGAPEKAEKAEKVEKTEKQAAPVADPNDVKKQEGKK